MRFLLLIMIFLGLTKCNPGKNETKARIIERKMLPDSQLLIVYTFTANNSQIVDSVEVKNKVIPHDSLSVIYLSSDPTKNTLKFE